MMTERDDGPQGRVGSMHRWNLADPAERTAYQAWYWSEYADERGGTRHPAWRVEIHPYAEPPRAVAWDTDDPAQKADYDAYLADPALHWDEAKGHRRWRAAYEATPYPVPGLAPATVTLRQWQFQTAEKWELWGGYAFFGADSSTGQRTRTDVLRLLMTNQGLVATVRLAPREAWEAALALAYDRETDECNGDGNDR